MLLQAGIPGTPYQSGLLQIRYYFPRIPIFDVTLWLSRRPLIPHYKQQCSVLGLLVVHRYYL